MVPYVDNSIYIHCTVEVLLESGSCSIYRDDIIAEIWFTFAAGGTANERSRKCSYLLETCKAEQMTD